MSNEPSFDLTAAHKYFAAGCFNNAWGLIEKKDRTAEDNEQMIQLAQASLWHWSQREDKTDRNMSVGYWQVSRIYALVGEAENARKYGKLCLEYSKNDEPFYLGFAYEALARAEMVAGDQAKMKKYLEEAQKQVEAVTKDDEKKMLLDDLGTIK